MVEKAIRCVASNPQPFPPLLRRLHSRLAQVATVVLGGGDFSSIQLPGDAQVGGAEQVVGLGVAGETAMESPSTWKSVAVFLEVNRAAAARHVALKPLIHVVALEQGRLQGSKWALAVGRKSSPAARRERIGAMVKVSVGWGSGCRSGSQGCFGARGGRGVGRGPGGKWVFRDNNKVAAEMIGRWV